MNRLVNVFFVAGKYCWMVFAGLIFCGVYFTSCKEKKSPEEKVIVEVPEKMDDKVKELLKSFLEYSVSENGKIDD